MKLNRRGFLQVVAGLGLAATVADRIVNDAHALERAYAPALRRPDADVGFDLTAIEMHDRDGLLIARLEPTPGGFKGDAIRTGVARTSRFLTPSGAINVRIGEGGLMLSSISMCAGQSVHVGRLVLANA